jgi:Tannase and feruloyl esterase
MGSAEDTVEGMPQALPSRSSPRNAVTREVSRGVVSRSSPALSRADPAGRLKVFTRLATERTVAACPGVVPTVIDDPTSCSFDPGSLACGGAEKPNCLTAAQVDAVRKIYAGPRNSRGAQIYPGLERGSEAAGGSTDAAGSWSQV